MWFVCQKFGVYNLPSCTICLSVDNLSRSAFVTGLSCQSASLICLFSVCHLSATFVKRGSLAKSGCAGSMYIVFAPVLTPRFV